MWGSPPPTGLPRTLPAGPRMAAVISQMSKLSLRGAHARVGGGGFPRPSTRRSPWPLVWTAPYPSSGRPRAGQQAAPERPLWTSVQKQDGRRFRFGRPAFTAFTGGQEELRPEAPCPSRPAPRQDAWKPPTTARAQSGTLSSCTRALQTPVRGLGPGACLFWLELGERVLGKRAGFPLLTQALSPRAVRHRKPE